MTKGLVLAVGLAAIMRLSGLGLIEFKADEALTVLSLESFWQKPEIIQAGLVSSTGVRNFPLFQYLLLPAAKISADPRFLSGFIGLINVLMIGWFYTATKRKFDSRIALIAGLLLAVSPYPVLYSRKIWAQDLIMLLAVPIYDLWLRSKPAYFWLGLLLVLQAQLHGSGIFFTMVVLAYLGWTKKINRRLIFGLLVGLLPALPYFGAGSFSRPQTPYSIDLAQLLMPIKLLSTFSWNQIVGEPDFIQFSSQSPAVGLGILASMVMLVGVGAGIYYHKRLAIIILGLVLIYGLGGVPARLHYYQVVLPYMALAGAMGLEQLFKKQPLFLGPTLALIVTADLLFWGMFVRYVAVNQGVSGDYGVPYVDSWPRVKQAIQPYIQREDIAAIRAYAHFDPVMAKQTAGKSIHVYLAEYFEAIQDKAAAEKERAAAR